MFSLQCESSVILYCLCSFYCDLSSLNPFFVSLSLPLSFFLSIFPSLLACFLLFISPSPDVSFLSFPFCFLRIRASVKICPNIYKRKCCVVKLNSEKMLHMLKKCIQHRFQMFPHAFLSRVSSVGAQYFISLFRQKNLQ